MTNGRNFAVLGLTALWILPGFAPGPAGAAKAKYTAAPSEVAQLPQFCWSQYVDDAEGPQYSISPRLCGVGMNHYCPGLVDLIRARRSFGDRKKLRDRLGHLNSALTNTTYTLRAMQNYPNCPIRSQVEATDAEVRVMRKSTERLLQTAPR